VHEEEPKLPINAKDMSKLGATPIEGEVNLETTHSEVSTEKAHVD